MLLYPVRQKMTLSNPPRAAASAAAVPAAEAQHEASADVTHGGAGDDGQLARPLLPEDRLAGGADAARAIADALELREVADGVVALAADRAQRRGLVLQEPVAEDAAAAGCGLRLRGEPAAEVLVLLLERLHLLVENADQFVDMLDV